MTDVAPRYTSIPIRHPHVAIYLIGLLVAWTVTTMTWTRSGGGRIELQPLAQVLQYLLVILAAVLAGDRLIRASMRREEADDATFGFYEHRWTVKRDLSGRVWWTCVWAGMAAMMLNVLLLIAAELMLTGADLGSSFALYLGWIGTALVVGGLLGTLATVVPLLIARFGRRT